CCLSSENLPSFISNYGAFFEMHSTSFILFLSILAGGAFGAPALEEVYRELVSLVNPGQQHLTGTALRSGFNTLEKRVQCAEVPCEKDLINTLLIHQLLYNISLSEFRVIVLGSVLYLSSPETACSAIKQGTWREETEHFLHEITHGEHHQHSEHHDHENIDVHASCVDAAELTEGQEDGEVGGVLGQVLLHALKGHCFMSQTLPEESFFLDDIMERLGSDNFTVEELKALMKSLNLRPDSDNDHGHDHSHSEHGHNRHNHRRKRSAHEHWEEHRENSTWDEVSPSKYVIHFSRFSKSLAIPHCFSAEELMRIFHSNSSSSDARSHLARLSPALVQQLLSGACTRTTNPVNPGDRLSKTERMLLFSTQYRYLYATLANVVITVLSMFGLVLLLCTSCTTVFQLCIQFCISLAVGSLTGDALLHLLPMFLGLHVHAEEGSSDHVHSDGPPDYVLKMLVVIAGIYCFYLMESLFSLISHKKHQHSHHHDESEPHHCDHGKVLEMYQQEKKQKKQKEKMQSVSKCLIPRVCGQMRVLVFNLLFIAGDFAILLHSGVSVRRALLLNVGSALTSFIGLYIALSIATDIATQQWIAAIATGLFLYVGLADMLPTLVHFDSRRPWTVFLLQNIGLLSGWGILLLLSLYEEKINF
uniref:Zinc transporter ZIP4 n=1 Tax=Neogobius melanostomus TaxID=47308 RepID=A0A8C6S5I2_9GOBI